MTDALTFLFVILMLDKPWSSFLVGLQPSTTAVYTRPVGQGPVKALI